jgi:hypothetical protein
VLSDTEEKYPAPATILGVKAEPEVSRVCVHVVGLHTLSAHNLQTFATGEQVIFVRSIYVNGPPLWSSGQSSWLQIRRPGFDSRHCQKKSSGSGTGSTHPREYN